MITPFDLENFGKTAALAYISDGTSMNSSILKAAADNNLNLQQVHRVVETANVDAYLNLIKASSDKYVDFPLANAKIIYTELTTDSSVNKSETTMDYENPPVKTAAVNLFPGVTQEGIDKVAEVVPSYTALRKEASKIEGICNYIADEATNTQREFMINYNKVWDFTKQAVLTNEPIQNVFEIIKVATPTYAGHIMDDFTDYMKETLPHIDISKEASYTGVINPKSSLYKLGEELEYLGDRFNNIAGAFVTFTEKYEELRKQANVLGGLKKLLLGSGQVASGAAAGIAKAIAAHKKLVLVGLGGAGVYQMGKSKGRHQQGEILQKRMLPPQYRNQI